MSLETGMFPLAHITASYGTQLGLYVTHQSPRPKEEPDDSTEDARRAGEVGAAAPPTDVDTTGSSPEIDAQAATTGPEDWTQNPYVQTEGGFLAGVSLGLVPLGGVCHQLLDAGEVLPHGTPEARFGLAVGLIVGGAASMAGGIAGEFFGGAATMTGIGAAVGVPAIVVSTTLVVGGAGNVAAGIRGLMTTGSGSAGSPRAASERGDTVRLRHFTNSKGLKGIQEESVIRARDQNKVFSVRAQGKPGSPRDVEEALRIRRGHGNNYVEFDARPGEFQVIRNPKTGATEVVFDGDLNLSGRNPTFHNNR